MSRMNLRKVIFAVFALVILLAAGCQEDTVAPPEQNAEPVGTDPSQKTVSDLVLLFGTVQAVEDHQLIVFIPPPIDPNDDPNIIWSEVQPGKRITNRPLAVIIDANTSVDHPDGDWFELETGSPVMLAGELTRAGLIAHLIADPRDLRLDPAAMPDLSANCVWEDGPPLELLIPEAVLADLPSSSNSSTDPSESTRNFPGKFGGPTKTFDSGHLGIPVFTAVLRTIFIDRIRPMVGLGGAEYDFPFTFVAEELNTLVVGQEGDLQIQVVHEPQTGGNYSYYWALGGNLKLTVEICDLDFSGWHCNKYDYNINFLSAVSATEDAAPLNGKKLDVPHDACPGFGFGIPGTDLNIASIDICTDQTFTGKNFDSYVSFHGHRSFDLDPETFRVIPRTNPLTFELRNFSYVPDLTIGYSLQLSVLFVPIYDTPTLVDMNAGPMPFIPTGDPNCGTFNMLYTCGDDQPTEVTLALPTIPVVTWVTAQPFITRYGDVLRLEALVEGANGPGDSPKEVGFYDGDILLATVPIDEADMAHFETSTLDPCRHVITAKYVGVDGEGNTYPSEKSVVAIVTGDDDTSRMEGYWQHQCLGMGDCDFDPETMDCYLAIAGELSRVFSEVRDISTGPAAHDVLFMGGNHGSALEQLDRELLVAWLNFANGSFRYDEVLDTDKDGIPDTPFQAVMEAAESVRLNPAATKRELKEQMQILHHIKDMITMSGDDLMDGR